MAINAYTGLMGSGKSYEVVENVILPALLSGRRVVTNVANLQQEEINAYLVEKCNAQLDNLGKIVQVSNDDILKADFFPVEVPSGVLASVSVVLPGDLIVVDECWRFWASGLKIAPAHMTFFRMHRHFVDPDSKVTCDIVLVVQDISDLDRKLKVVVENTYRMAKHKSLGSVSRYRVDIFASYKTARPPIRSLQRKYNKEIFKLYQSYSQGSGSSGNEVAIDDRSNIFKGVFFSFVLPISILLFFLFILFLWRFFHPSSPASTTNINSDSVSSIPVRKVSAPLVNKHSIHPSPLLTEDSTDWRVKGFYRSGLNSYIVLVRSDDAVRYLVNPSGWSTDPLRVSGIVDGKLVTNYTAASNISKSALVPEFKK